MAQNIPAMLLRTFSTWEENQDNTDLSGVVREFLNSQGINTEQFYDPPVDLCEDDTTIEVYMDIPGVNLDTIDLNFYNNKIEVVGERVKPYDGSRKQEIVYGKFKKKITIPISVTSKNSVDVSTDNGVLKIVIDKTNEERNRFNVKVSTHSSSEGTRS